ncbi:MAG TPA: hypothetical protein VGH16_23570 [Candidatus Binatia bacterium]|jgi:hypothetical protein
MQTGIWKLKCQSCKKPFNLHITSNTLITDLIGSQPCPHCRKKPGDLDARNCFVEGHELLAYVPSARAKPLLASGKSDIVTV